MGHTCNPIEVKIMKNSFNNIIKDSFENNLFDKLRVCFSVIDLISHVLEKPKDLDKNKATPLKSVRFIREVMGEVKPLYKELAAILYVWFRHSLVHSFMPNAGLKLKDNETITFCISSKKGKHLIFVPAGVDVLGAKIWKFYFNADQFKKDIISAIGNWIDTSTRVDALFENYKKVVEITSTLMKECDLINERKKYDIQKDFDYIHEILKSWRENDR